eukprot:6096667-Pyramimonas_sp.AAC.2
MCSACTALQSFHVSGVGKERAKDAFEGRLKHMAIAFGQREIHMINGLYFLSARRWGTQLERGSCAARDRGPLRCRARWRRVQIRHGTTRCGIELSMNRCALIRYAG